MNEIELRALCQRFFDALDRGDTQTVAELYAPDFRIWVNLTGSESTREQSLETLRKGAGLHRRRSYDDRRIQTFANGFVVQYSVNVVAHGGQRVSLDACLVAQCRDGRIARIDEYLDSGRFRAPARTPRDEKESGA